MLKVGDYVRTKWGTIAQIDKCLGKDVGYKNMEHYEVDRLIGLYNDFILYENDIKKSDPEIIYLVEVGDYVNGIEVHCVYDDDSEVNDYNLKHKKCIGTNIYDTDFQESLIYEEDIKAIVTKEQFESMQYKVGEN